MGRDALPRDPALHVLKPWESIFDLSLWLGPAFWHAWRGRVALPRDRRCAFTEHEQAKGVNVGKGLRRRNQQREVSRRANAGRAGAHPYRRRLAIRDIRDPVQRCVQPKYQTLLSLLPFAFIRVFGGQLFLIGLGVLLFKLSSLSFVGAVAPSGSRGSLEHRVAAR